MACSKSSGGFGSSGFTAFLATNGSHSHSIVAGGLELISYTTRLTPFTSLMIRVEIRAKQVVGQMAPVGGHEVFGLDRADGDRRLHRSGHRPSRRRSAPAAARRTPATVLPIQPGLLDFVDHDRVGLAEHVQSLLGHFAEAAHGQAGAGKRMPPDDVFRQAQLQAQAADFVLEQIPERLDQLEAKFARAVRRRCGAS